ncbi:MAG: hypothetical protein MMC23_000573 [Stictis urceolatum]|nr:hypothetical protein [Stictis urceolata]
MADRFPSIEDFDEGDTEVKGGASGSGVANANDDFLTRERAALGDDADFFAATGDDAVMNEDASNDLLGGGDMIGGEEVTEFESSFPAIDNSNNQVGPGGRMTGTSYGQQSSYGVPAEETEVIKEWRERRDLALQHRAETAEKKKGETVKAAQQAVDDFYENYNNKKEKTINATRKDAEEYLKNREDTSSGGTSWERIAKLVDLSGKGAKGGGSASGKEKFREMLASLKKDENAPGASGV